MSGVITAKFAWVVTTIESTGERLRCSACHSPRTVVRVDPIFFATVTENPDIEPSPDLVRGVVDDVAPLAQPVLTFPA